MESWSPAAMDFWRDQQLFRKPNQRSRRLGPKNKKREARWGKKRDVLTKRHRRKGDNKIPREKERTNMQKEKKKYPN